MKNMRQFAFAIVFLAVALTSAANGSKVQAQTLRLIAVVDGSSLLCEAAEKDAELVARFFDANKADSALKFAPVRKIRLDDPKRKTKQYVLQQIRNLPSGPNDVLVCYYSGHGEHDGTQKIGQYLRLYSSSKAENERQKAEFLLPCGELRAELQKKIANKQARLVVIFTDCCNKIAKRSNDKGALPIPLPTSAFDRLFAESTGVVHITSSKIDEVSIAFGEEGSVGTLALIDAFNHVADENPGPDENIWRVAFNKLAEYSNARFRYKIADCGLNIGQSTQTPYPYALGDEDVRLGANVLANAKEKRAYVKGVKRNSPAARAGLKVGDVILKINDIDVVNESVYNYCVDVSPKNANFVVERAGDETVELAVELAGTPKTPLYGCEPEEVDAKSAPDDASTGKRSNFGMKKGGLNGDASVEAFGAFVDDKRQIVLLDFDSPAEIAGLRIGDVVLSVDGARIFSQEEYAKALDAATAVATVVVKRGTSEKTFRVRFSGVLKLTPTSERAPVGR